MIDKEEVISGDIGTINASRGVFISVDDLIAMLAGAGGNMILKSSLITMLISLRERYKK